MFVDVDRHGSFRLSDGFVEDYRERPVPWGFGALSWVVYKRTYSRNGEEWWQTCRRVVEGMMTVQRAYCRANRRPWDEGRARSFAEEAFDRMWRFKWTPPGRGLWIMGTSFLYERGGAALNNCGFVSTRNLAADYSDPFLWMFEMSMLGVGVGFDTRGRGSREIEHPVRAEDVHVIGDSREGWGEALRRLLDAYVGKGALPARWGYERVRPAGTPLRSFGGVASGPRPLREMLAMLEELYDGYVGRRVDAALIVDTMNIIGRCVVAGGVRRSAQIAFGSAGDVQFLDLKADRARLADYRWVSNNSIYASIGMDYGPIVERTQRNGEPGYFWLENARRFGRLCDPPNERDAGADGSNPCVEQTLWDRELCCLVETFPAHHRDLADYLQTIRIAYEYAKTVTLVPISDPRTNEVVERNRRIGCSMTGIVQAINAFGYRAFLRLCEAAYQEIQRLDREHSQRLGVVLSIKTTSVKPSGTVSILGGATPGVHWEHAPYYLRRVRFTKDHPLVDLCRKAGYLVEEDAVAPNTMVVAFPVRVRNLGRGKTDVSLWEKVDLAAQMQRYWSDNQVSCTSEFDPEREGAALPRILSAYEDRLKAVVFLPARGHGYAQPPYEEVTRERYEAAVSRLSPLSGEIGHENELEARFCEGGLCDVEIGAEGSG